MREHQLELEEVPATVFTWARVVLIIANFVAMLSVFLVWRGRRKRRIQGLLLFLCFSCSPSSFAVDTPNVAWNGGWALRSGVNPSTYISQCGFDAAVVALRLFHVDFEPYSLAYDLEPTAEGVSAFRLQTSLADLGLDVITRKNVAFSSVIESLTSSDIAIIPVRWKSGSEPHYIVVARIRDKGVCVLDPPSLHPLSNSVISQDFIDENDDNVVLIVSKHSDLRKASREADGLRLTPRRLVPRSATVSNTTVGDKIVVSNCSIAPIKLRQVISGCSCVRVLDTKSEVLMPGESKIIRVEINWNQVSSSGTEVSLLCHDGSESRFHVLRPDVYADIPKVERVVREIRYLTVPAEFTFSLDKPEPVVSSVVHLNLSSKAADLVVESSKSWCQCSHVEANGRCKLVLDVVPDAGLLREIEGQRSGSAMVVVFEKSGLKKLAEFQIEIARTRIADISTGVISAEDVSAIAAIRVLRDGWSVVDVTLGKSSHGMDVAVTKVSGNDWQVRFSRTTEGQGATVQAICELRLNNK